MPESLRIVVSGMVAGVPHHGGATWAVLQYVLGFRRLGHDVLLVEPVEALTNESVEYFDAVTADFELTEDAALLAIETGETSGLPYGELVRRARRADVLVNVSGMLRAPELTEGIPTRVYLDLDPAFNQLWHEQGIDAGLEGHTHHVTVGLALGSADCCVPTCGVEWLTTLQPVVLDRWPRANGIVYDGLTTVGNWRGYGSIERDGVLYGQKAHSYREFIALPLLTDEPVLAALAIHPDETRDLTALAENRWRLLDPLRAAGTPGRYGDFVRGSKAELGIAKSGYVASRNGWFSDRSVCYLASGRPVVAQETGFGRFLPTGDGLFAFETMDELLRVIDALRGDYERHRRAARSLAEDLFDSDRVLARLLACLS